MQCDVSLNEPTRASNTLLCQEDGRTGLDPQGASFPAAGEGTCGQIHLPWTEDSAQWVFGTGGLEQSWAAWERRGH